ncbi:hypothetical protein [Thermotoga sp.]|uniref:hypothetical protein n=1 Tax=Thermotoga sp. TaxID=28240 RepID=UPI0025ECDD63|nr:hypothetical protein [Thermotoga sp.]MCD6551768.1 hypothetical protein [Thermotoga sp.]
MIVTYHLERWRNREIVRLELMEEGSRGISSIVPEKSLGENYKTVVAVLEEYEGFLKEAKSGQIFGLFEELEEYFPEHPKVLFSLSCAVLNLFSKRYGVSFEEMLDVPGRAVETVERSDVLVFPEVVGHVLRVAGFLSAMRSVGEKVCLVVREYPDPITNSILNLLKKLSNGFVEGSWG